MRCSMFDVPCPKVKCDESIIRLQCVHASSNVAPCRSSIALKREGEAFRVKALREERLALVREMEKETDRVASSVQRSKAEEKAHIDAEVSSAQFALESCGRYLYSSIFKGLTSGSP